MFRVLFTGSYGFRSCRPVWSSVLLRANILAGGILLAIVSVCFVQASTNRITRDQAESLVRGYLRSEGYDAKAAPLDIEPNQAESNSDFYLLTVYVDTPEIGHNRVVRR